MNLQKGNIFIIALVIIIIIAGFGIFLYRGAALQQKALTDDIPPPPPLPTLKDLNSQLRLVKLDPVNNSGADGVAIISREDKGISVQIELTPVSDVSRLAHIHSGTCATLGGIVYGLTNVENGKSFTALETSFADVTSGFPRVVAVHASASLPSAPIACGQIPEIAPPVEVGAEDKMIQPPDGEDGVVEARPLKEIAITGKNFEFSQKEIRVKKGDFVRINFSSTDGLHDWVVDEFNAKTTQVNTGQSSSVDFVADKAGTFEFYCGVGTHRKMGMIGKLIVEE
ncbi:MAG: plastocyanin [Parcubacteria group bacterium Gr01-1014_29]|nr:MAG: plastocyanin [Parcubacteria group bacterium Gr01-1014_29]